MRDRSDIIDGWVQLDAQRFFVRIGSTKGLRFSKVPKWSLESAIENWSRGLDFLDAWELLQKGIIKKHYKWSDKNWMIPS